MIHIGTGEIQVDLSTSLMLIRYNVMYDSDCLRIFYVSSIAGTGPTSTDMAFVSSLYSISSAMGLSSPPVPLEISMEWYPITGGKWPNLNGISVPH